jgi:hypothetical protein
MERKSRLAPMLIVVAALCAPPSAYVAGYYLLDSSDDGHFRIFPTKWLGGGPYSLDQELCFLNGRESGPRDPTPHLARPLKLIPGVCTYVRVYIVWSRPEPSSAQFFHRQLRTSQYTSAGVR